ncbi:hypothetical protein AIF0345_0014 [Actinomyces israelii]|nr:hypothetical protein AIF0345_0014 [Actinomyces israelii]
MSRPGGRRWSGPWCRARVVGAGRGRMRPPGRRARSRRSARWACRKASRVGRTAPAASVPVRAAVCFSGASQACWAQALWRRPCSLSPAAVPVGPAVLRLAGAAPGGDDLRDRVAPPGAALGAFSRARGEARVRPGPGCGEYARRRGVLLRVGDGSQGVGRGPGGLGGHCRVTCAGPGAPGASGRRRGALTHPARQPTVSPVFQVTVTPQGPRWRRAGPRATSRRPLRLGRTQRSQPGPVAGQDPATDPPARPGPRPSARPPTSIPMKTPTPPTDTLTTSPLRLPGSGPAVRQPTPHPCPRQTTPRQQAAPPVSASPHPLSWATPAPRDHDTQGPRHHAGPDRPGPGPVPRTTNKVTGSWGQTPRKSQGSSASTHSGGQPSTPGGVHNGGETRGLSAGFSPPVGGPVENNAVVFPQVCAQLWMNHSGVLPQIHSLEQTCG